ncbi:MAG: phosphatidate cytidylyltransferase [Anaerolineales bacterium]
MFWQRTLFTLVALPVGLTFVFVGGVWYAGFIAIILMRAAWEYADLFRNGGGKSAQWILVAGVLAICVSRFIAGFQQDHWILAAICMVTISFYLLAYERGHERAASDFAATLSGIFYVGLLGSYLILIRQLPENGDWWVVLTIFAVMLADTTAYMYGTRFGKRRLAPQLSPKKSWEGFLSGVVAATVGMPLFLLLFRFFGLPDEPAFSLANAALMGFLIGVLTTLGDLGISMIKREMKLKDTSAILPGHGGVLDRIDSWLWAFPIGYYLVLFLFLNA